MTTPIRITTADEESVGSSSVLTPVTHTTNDFTHVERMDGTDTDSFTDITATTMASDDWTAPFVHVVVHHHHDQETADTPTMALEEPQQPTATATPVTRNSLRQASNHLRMTAGMPVGYQPRRGSPLAGRYNTNVGDAARVLVKSTKQGPSQRKIRRWNNDKFVGVAAELSNPKAAEAFSLGEAEAHHHALPNAPRQYRSSFASLVEDENGLEDVRSRFVRGEVGAAPRDSDRIRNSRSKEVQLQTIFSNGTLMLDRLPERLRGIAVRAVSTSEWAAQAVTTLEDFLVGLSTEEKDEPDAIQKYNVLWNAILVQPPRVTWRHAESSSSGNNAICQFLFDLNRNPKQAAFHRLLLHAVCHFHGLSATSDTVARLEARALTVTGTCRGSHIRLVDVAKSHFGGPPLVVLPKNASLDSHSTNHLPVDQVVESLSSLKVS